MPDKIPNATLDTSNLTNDYDGAIAALQWAKANNAPAYVGVFSKSEEADKDINYSALTIDMDAEMGAVVAKNVMELSPLVPLLIGLHKMVNEERD